MKVDVVNMQGEKVSTTELPAAIFEVRVKADLMHQAFERQMANARAGTHATKTRSDVRGGGRKPWRQKGTGRARHGSIRSPIWVGGGKVHTPHPRDYSKRMPKKMRRAALRSALSVKAAAAGIVVLDELRLDQIKTKEVASMLNRLVGQDSALILMAETDELVEKSARNLANAKTLRAEYLNVRDLLGHKRLVLPLNALEAITAHLGK
ncbi:MAG TPA: 50S ribosomal protein L4 [Anaerolineales bacterium]